MSRPRLIADYLVVLLGWLPELLTEELADGLAEAYRRCLGLGLGPGAAAEAAVAEFGDQQLIAAEFARASPARRAARRLRAVLPPVLVLQAERRLMAPGARGRPPRDRLAG